MTLLIGSKENRTTMIKFTTASVVLMTISLMVYSQNPKSGTLKIDKPGSGIHVASIAGTFGGSLSARQLIKAGGIDLTPSNDAEVISFNLSAGLNHIFQTLRSSGPLLNSRMFDLIRNLPAGSEIFFQDIRAITSDSTIIFVNPISIIISKDSVIHNQLIYPALAEFAGIIGEGYISSAKLNEYKYLKVNSNGDNFTVKKFSIHANFGETGILHSSSNEITAEMRALYAGLRKGTWLVFDNIIAESTRGKRIIVSPLILKMK
ncbi:MAG: hypothetical protein COB85_09165 [Bacteroidetes bacterium]|nr:MAG: hypothetical protein COB85_09165 [Bacteroidota bacterium]